jgi:hypothetical protein
LCEVGMEQRRTPVSDSSLLFHLKRLVFVILSLKTNIKYIRTYFTNDQARTVSEASVLPKRKSEDPSQGYIWSDVDNRTCRSRVEFETAWEETDDSEH